MLGSAWIDKEPCGVPGSVCVEPKPNAYLVFRTLDRPAEALRQRLEERKAMVYRGP